MDVKGKVYHATCLEASASSSTRESTQNISQLPQPVGPPPVIGSSPFVFEDALKDLAGVLGKRKVAYEESGEMRRIKVEPS